VYDHCPFCVRVRVAAGVLGVEHKLVFMGNDDVETPTEMVGKKIAPIWKDADGPMMESLDIIAKLDTENKLAPASGRTDIKAWQKSVQTLMRKLQRPRYVMVPLPEFMQKSGRDAFVANHQMPPFEKSDWKGNPDMSLEQKYGYYEEAFASTKDLLAEANEKVKELGALVSHTPRLSVHRRRVCPSLAASARLGRLNFTALRARVARVLGLVRSIPPRLARRASASRTTTSTCGPACARLR